jgi:peptide/nickel transport system substrate-binding protein
MLRYLSSVLLLVFLASLIVSCERSHTPSTKKNPGNENILRYDVSAPLTSLNPPEVAGSGSTVIFPLLYSYLFVPNGNGELEPDLALKWTYEPEHLTWTIHLRKDARFHDKEPVTSRDVRYSFEIALRGFRSYLSALVDRISLLSATAISIRLTKDDPKFLEKMWDMEILPYRSERSMDFYNHPIGSGPFRFKRRKGEMEVFLEANEDYFQGRPCLDGVIFYFQPDKEKAWTRLLSGKTDIAQEISPKNYEMMRQYEKRYYFDLYPLHWYTILLYNTRDPHFSDARVRLGLSHAIDTKYIVRQILRGFGVVAVGPMGVGSAYHNPEVNPMAYNAQEGLKLLEEAGWSFDKEGRYLEKGGRCFEFTLLVLRESQIEKKVAQYLQLSLNDLGIKVHLQSVPHTDLFNRYFRNDAFQAVLTEASGVYRDPEFIKSMWTPDLFKRSEAGAFEHPDVTRLIGQALDETDPTKQKELFYEIDALIMSLQPGTFLFHKTAIDVMSKRFKLAHPFSLTHEGICRLRHASLNPN